MEGNWIDQLKELNVEIKSVGEVCDEFIEGDTKITKSLENSGNFPAIICSDIFNSNIQIDRFSVFLNENSMIQKAPVEKGNIVVARSGYTDKNTGGCCLFLEEFKALAGNDTYVLKHSQNPKYLINAVSTESFKQQTKSFFKPGLINRIYLSEVKKIKIPLPDLKIQERIGNFLFSFTEYDKRLNKELEKRRKQFYFYKEQIFEDVLEKCRLRS